MQSMSGKNNPKNTSEKSVFDLSTRQLRDEIRKRTASVNVRLMEYREAVKQGSFTVGEQQFVDKNIEAIRKATATEKLVTKKVDGKRVTVRTGEYYIPEGRKGEIGLGLTHKTKAELQKQLAALRRFEKSDILTPQGKRQWKDKTQRQYETFRNRYNEKMSETDYQDMIDTMSIIKEALKDYGYEDFGADYARQYAKANTQGRNKFIKYIEQAKREKAGSTANDILDRVAELLRENKEIQDDV